jgi:hypothetical protein
VASREERRAAWDEAVLVFGRLSNRVGHDEATRVFTRIAKQAFSRRGKAYAQNSMLLTLYELLPPDAKSVPILWRIVCALNHHAEKNGDPRRFGPRGSQSLAAFERHMSRVLAERRKYHARTRKGLRRALEAGADISELKLAGVIARAAGIDISDLKLSISAPD